MLITFLNRLGRHLPPQVGAGPGFRNAKKRLGKNRQDQKDFADSIPAVYQGDKSHRPSQLQRQLKFNIQVDLIARDIINTHYITAGRGGNGVINSALWISSKIHIKTFADIAADLKFESPEI